MFRSKVCGITGIIHEVDHLEEMTTPAPILLTGCDSLLTLYRYMKPVHSIKAQWHHCDILSHLQASIHSNKSKHTWLHIKAHLSRTQPRTKLSPNAILNEKMDALAGMVMDAYSKAIPITPTLGMPIVWVGKSQLKGNIKQSVYICLTRHPIKDYLEDRKFISHGSYNLAAWDALCKAQGSDHNRDLCISKMICNQIPTLQIIHRRKQVVSDKCPFCHTAVKDV